MVLDEKVQLKNGRVIAFPFDQPVRPTLPADWGNKKETTTDSQVVEVFTTQIIEEIVLEVEEVIKPKRTKTKNGVARGKERDK